MTIEEVWEQYKKQRDGDHFTDNASVVFVPTASGARGYDAVRQFLSTAYDSRILNVRDKVIFQTIGENSIVEESETTINFITGEGAWLAPGVDSRYTIDSKIVIPTITSASFEGDRISSIRLYWDQASALKQLKLISDKNSWPIVGEKQVDAVRDIASAHLNPFGKTDRLAAGVAGMNINQQQQGPPPGRRPVHTSSRVNQPGGTGGKSSNIFGDYDPFEDVSRNKHRVNQPGGNGGRSSVFGDSDTTEDNAQRGRFHSNKNASQFSIGDGADQRQQDNSSISGSSKRRGKSQFESSVEFGDDGGDQSQRSSVKPSSRVLKPPGGGSSQIFFG